MWFGVYSELSLTKYFSVRHQEAMVVIRQVLVASVCTDEEAVAEERRCCALGSRSGEAVLG